MKRAFARIHNGPAYAMANGFAKAIVPEFEALAEDRLRGASAAAD